jgi:hypothetical protein
VNALWLNLRTSPLRWTLPPLVVLTLAVLYFQPPYWRGIWPETGAAAQVPAFFLSVIAAGAAAWISGATSRHRLDEQLAAAAVPTATAEAYRLGASAIILTAPYLVGQAVAFVVTAVDSPAGFRLWLGYLGLGLLTMLFSIAWGWVIGRYFGAAYSALVALLSWLVFESFVGSSAALNVVGGPAWKQVDTATLALRMAVVAVFLVAVALTPVRRSGSSGRWWRGAMAGTLVPVAAAGVAIATTMVTTGVVDRPVPRSPVCVEGRIEMCLWPENEKYVPIVRSIDATVATLPAEFRLPGTLYEYGLRRDHFDDAGTTYTELAGDFDISEGSRWGLATGVSNAILDATLGSCDWDAILAAKELGPEALKKWVEFHLMRSATPEYRTSGVSEDMRDAWATAARTFIELPAEGQSAWAREELGRIQARYCG